MRILYHNEGEDNAFWLSGLRSALPQADIRLWLPGDNQPADYALVWKPPLEMLAGRTGLKAIFNLAAGVDSLLEMGEALPHGLPIIRLEDAGMAVQMAEYVTHSVLRYFRRFDEYDLQAKERDWEFLASHRKADFTIGIMGLGALGSRVAQALLHFGFPVNGWSRNKKILPRVHCFAGDEALNDFLRATRVLVCALPLTAATDGLLNREALCKLEHGAYLINVGRGAHLVEADLLEALDSGRIEAATLDVFRDEPLPLGHPFWQAPRITITPHVAAETLRDATVRQVAEKLLAFERGEPVSGIVDRSAGY